MHPAFLKAIIGIVLAAIAGIVILLIFELRRSSSAIAYKLRIKGVSRRFKEALEKRTLEIAEYRDEKTLRDFLERALQGKRFSYPPAKRCNGSIIACMARMEFARARNILMLRRWKAAGVKTIRWVTKDYFGLCQRLNGQKTAIGKHFIDPLFGKHVLCPPTRPGCRCELSPDIKFGIEKIF